MATLILTYSYCTGEESYPSPVEMKKRKDTFVVIMGAGFSGLCTAVKLKQAGIRFVLIEKSDRIGGTWAENVYPGCACDTKSHVYSLSFKLNPFWSKPYAEKSEILAYLEDSFDYYGIREYVKFGQRVDKCTFDKTTQKWTVVTTMSGGEVGESLECNFLVSGCGVLHIPKYPGEDDKEDNGRGLTAEERLNFKGESFHTAQWDKNFDWTDKRVAVVGTGCSSVQVVPSIAPKCQHLYVFQRSAAWIGEKDNFKYPRLLQRCFQMFPFVMRLYRWYIFLKQEIRFQQLFTKGSRMAAILQKFTIDFMRTQITKDERNLQEKLIPKYNMGCKRITQSDCYLAAFNRSNVSLITEPIVKITEKGIAIKEEKETNKEHDEERSIELDAIIYATGFNIQNSLINIDIERPRDGKGLIEVWGNTPTAYLGIMPLGFPNFFMLLGPTTGLGHNSVVYMIECQVTFLVNAIKKTIDKGCSSLEVTSEAHEDFQAYVRSKMTDRVFSSGCTSWYRNSEGYNYALWPSNCFNYWWRTSRIIEKDFTFTK